MIENLPPLDALVGGLPALKSMSGEPATTKANYMQTVALVSIAHSLETLAVNSYPVRYLAGVVDDDDVDYRPDVGYDLDESPRDSFEYDPNLDDDDDKVDEDASTAPELAGEWRARRQKLTLDDVKEAEEPAADVDPVIEAALQASRVPLAELLAGKLSEADLKAKRKAEAVKAAKAAKKAEAKKAAADFDMFEDDGAEDNLR